MANDYDFDASSYPLWQPGWVPPMAPPSPYGNDLLHALAATLRIHPSVLSRFDAALASSPRSADQNGAAPSDQRATGYDQFGERGAVDVAKQFGPSNTGGFADATSPVNPASYGSNVPAPGLASVPIDDRDLRWAVTNTMAALYGQKFRPYMAGRTFGALESLVADAPQPFTLAHVDVALRQLGDIAAGQGPDAAAAALAADDLRKRMPNLAPRDVSAGDPAAAPTMLQDDRAPAQWWRPEAPASQGPDALSNAQPMSWPEPAERGDFRSWAPNQQPTNEGRETGPSDLVRMLTGFGQGGVATNSWSGEQAGAQPQWWRPEAPPSRWPDAPANTQQPTSAPAVPDQRDLKDWWPTQQPTSEGRETGPSDSHYSIEQSPYGKAAANSSDSQWTDVSAVRRPRSGGSPGIRINGRVVEATPAQEARFAAANDRAEDLFRRVWALEPNWKPRPSFYDSTAESAIARALAEAREAEMRLHVLERNEAFHYTFSRRLAEIERDGLREGAFATLTEDLSPTQAHIDLALRPNRGLPGALIRLNLEALRRDGYKIPEIRPVGRDHGMPGGGFEIEFPYAIPSRYLRVIRP